MLISVSRDSRVGIISIVCGLVKNAYIKNEYLLLRHPKDDFSEIVNK